jgi:hypothetical protein
MRSPPFRRTAIQWQRYLRNRAKWSATPTTTCDTARPTFLSPWMLKAGTLIAEVHWHHRSVELRHYLQTVGRATPVEFDLHFVLDNTSVHKSPIIQRWLLRHPRICTCRPPRPHVSTWWMLALDSYGTKAHARAVPLHSDIGERRSRSRSHPQCKPQTLRLDEDGRPGPSVRRRVLYTNFRITPLAGCTAVSGASQ